MGEYERRMDRTWQGVDRRVQKPTGSLGFNDRRKSTVLAYIQKEGNSKGNDGWVESGLRSFVSNANPIGSISREKRGKAMNTIGDKLMALFRKVLCKEERRQLDQLKDERVDQERRLEEITKAALDGEDNWFKRVLMEDPTCVLRALDACDKEKK